jgi:hypothetical protein
MATPTYILLASSTLASASSSYTFSSISQSYKDLVVVITATSSANNTDLWMYVNGNTSAIYDALFADGNGSSATSSNTSDIYMKLNLNATIQTTTGYNAIVNVMDYSSSNFKNVIARTNIASKAVDMSFGLAKTTTAVTSITFINTSGTYSIGSTFALYGIAA